MIRWLWKDRVARGKITCFCGNPDNGKSVSTSDLVFRVSTGTDFCDSENALGPSEVIMMVAEDALDDTVVPRLMVARADLTKIHFVTSVALSDSHVGTQKARMLELDSDLNELRMTLDEHPNARLIVIDPISNYLGKTKMVDERDVRQHIMNPLAQLAEERGIAIIIVLHLNKKEDLSAISRVGGAMAFVGAARSTWMFMRDKENPDQILMLKVKNNVAKRSLGGLIFKIKAEPLEIDGQWSEQACCEWVGCTDDTADDALAKAKNVAGDEADALAGEKSWLKKFLSGGPMPAESCYDEAKDEKDITPRTLERAKAALKVTSVKKGRGWLWCLPEHVPAEQSPLPGEMREVEVPPFGGQTALQVRQA